MNKGVQTVEQEASSTLFRCGGIKSLIYIQHSTNFQRPSPSPQIKLQLLVSHPYIYILYLLLGQNPGLLLLRFSVGKLYQMWRGRDQLEDMKDFSKINSYQKY
jgi:hypothetical protein